MFKDLFKTYGCKTMIVAFLLLIAFVVSLNFLAVWLWDIIAVEVFALPVLGFWKMMGLQVLLWILIPTGKTWNNG